MPEREEDPEPLLLSPPSGVAAEVEVDADLVRRLLEAQHPDLATQPISKYAEGWDNNLFRIGESWLARLPRRSAAAPLVALELEWLPRFAPELPLALPVPIRAGLPGAGYPWPWSISRWLPGRPAAGSDLDPRGAATALGRFLAALHALEVPEGAPSSAHRGVPPRLRGEPFLDHLAGLSDSVDGDRIARAWHALTDVQDWTGSPVWCHGDLHPFNLLVENGRLSAVLDWGDFHAAEPAPDLAVAWLLLPRSEHPRFRETCGRLDDDTWQRGKAWGLYLAVMFVSAGRAGAGRGATLLGQEALRRILG